MWRRIFVNLVLAFVVLPGILILRDYIRIVIYHDHRFFTGTFWAYFHAMRKMVFIVMPLVLLLAILLPYNIIVMYYSKKRKSSFFFKFRIFLCIALLISFYFYSLAFNPSLGATYYLGVFAIIALCSLLCVFAIHYLVYRKTLLHI